MYITLRKSWSGVSLSTKKDADMCNKRWKKCFLFGNRDGWKEFSRKFQKLAIIDSTNRMKWNLLQKNIGNTMCLSITCTVCILDISAIW